MAEPTAPERTTVADQAARQAPRTDEAAAGKLQSQSSAGEGAVIRQGEPTSPNYGGPYLLQYRKGETAPAEG